jgi:dCMP deaminase
MFLGIAGPICSGKRTIADFLIQTHSFTRLRLRPTKSSSDSPAFDSSTPLATPDTELANGLQGVEISGQKNGQPNGDKAVDLNGSRDEDGILFDTMAEMTEFVTKRWRQDFVTVDIWREEDLEVVIKRPFFLLISVDAPIGIRWKRFTERYQVPFPCFVCLSCQICPLHVVTR